jgi:hypothetical protein
VKPRLFIAVVTAQLFLMSTPSWADSDTGAARPRISNIGGDDHSPGVTLVIILALLLIGFGVGFVVGRRTRRK